MYVNRAVRDGRTGPGHTQAVLGANDRNVTLAATSVFCQGPIMRGPLPLHPYTPSWRGDLKRRECVLTFFTKFT